MKKYHLLLMISAVLLAVASIPEASFAQDNKDSAKTAAVAELVANQDYTFIAQSVTPLSGRLRQLTTEYSLKISKDVIVAQLPYFGRAYSAPINTSDAGIQFTSKDFEYQSAARKKSGWNINIKFKDTHDAKQMQLTVFNNGRASLQVISNNRQSISYDGYITASRK